MFTVGGTFGFLIDAAVLMLMLRLVGAGLYSGRLASYIVAATFTWAFHRAITFRTAARSHRGTQWLTFLLANAVGGLVNLGVYAVLVAGSPWVAQRPVIAVAAGSVSGLAFNFFASRIIVFRLRAGASR